MIKNVLQLAAALLLPATSLLAQPSSFPARLSAGRMHGSRPAQPSKETAPDKVVMAGGAVLAVRGRQTQELTHDLILADGTTVNAWGIVSRPSGEQVTLADGQSISYKGALSQPAPRPDLASPVDGKNQ